MIVILADIRETHFCTKGSRAFFARHGLDWSDFLRNGIDADALLATNDAMAAQVVETALRRTGGE